MASDHKADVYRDGHVEEFERAPRMLAGVGLGAEAHHSLPFKNSYGSTVTEGGCSTVTDQWTRPSLRFSARRSSD